MLINIIHEVHSMGPQETCAFVPKPKEGRHSAPVSSHDGISQHRYLYIKSRHERATSWGDIGKSGPKRLRIRASKPKRLFLSLFLKSIIKLGLVV